MLKSIQKVTHLRNFAGQTLGVDAYGWLHRGTVSCAIELAEQKPTRKHIDFALSRVRMLLHFGVKPYLVFDGDYLPSKAHTEKERAARRKESRERGLEMLRAQRYSQAHLELQKAVDVTPSMARELIEELKALGVPYVVAPYEADAQLAYLEKQGLISGVLSEDSDLLVFGVQCLLTKLDQYGECVMVNRADFTACREVSLVGWSDAEFRMMAMLSGCDYLPGIDKMGLKTAYRLVRKHKTLERLIRSVQFDGKMRVPSKYLASFRQAEKTFLHQWVYCAEAKCLRNLNPLSAGDSIADMPYLGENVEPRLAQGVAKGDLDPNTKQPLTYIKRAQAASARSRTVHTPDEKPGKSITEFFKAQRTPLAELDPNSFTPSPSQHRLLAEQQNASWSATQPRTSREPALSRVVATNRRASAPLSGRPTNMDAFSLRVSPKRRRLCSETLAKEEDHVEHASATSRFFSTQPAPGSAHQSRRPTKKKDDFELWSDDPAAEAVAVLTAKPPETELDTTPSPKKRKKLQVYADAPVGSAHQSINVPSQSTVTTATSSAPQQTLTATQATSLSTTTSLSQSSIFSRRVEANFAALKNKFAFQSLPANTPRRHQSSRLMQCSDKCGDITRPQRCEGDEEKPAVDDAPHQQVEHVVPASSPQPSEPPAPTAADKHCDAAAAKQRNALEAAQGSEDLLIPNSPGNELLPHQTLDFRQFAYTG